jgi:hypothetical protein
MVDFREEAQTEDFAVKSCEVMQLALDKSLASSSTPDKA